MEKASFQSVKFFQIGRILHIHKFLEVLIDWRNVKIKYRRMSVGYKQQNAASEIDVMCIQVRNIGKDVHWHSLPADFTSDCELEPRRSCKQSTFSRLRREKRKSFVIRDIVSVSPNFCSTYKG